MEFAYNERKLTDLIVHVPLTSLRTAPVAPPS